MNSQREHADNRRLVCWERLWLDPEWDAVHGYGDRWKGEKGGEDSDRHSYCE